MFVENDSNNAPALTFAATSTFSPVIDLANPGNSGSVVVANNGNIVITDNPDLQPIISNAVGQASGPRSFQILETDGDINGVFADIPDTVALKDVTFSDGMLSARYVTPGDNLAGSIGPNTSALLAMFANPASAALNGTPLGDIYDAMHDSNLDDAAQRALASAAQRGLTPHSLTRMANFSINQLDAVQRVFSDNVTGALVRTPAAGDAWGPIVWATPIFETGSRRAKTNEFARADQDFGGIALGLGNSIGDISFGGQIHYLRGRLDSIDTDIDTNTFGLTLGGRIDRLLPAYDSEGNSTWIQANIGYSRENIDQTRRSLLGSHDSSPDANLWRLGASVGRDLAAGAARISPEFGFDYTRVSLESYTESGGIAALHVNPENFDSFRLKLGASVEVPVEERLSLTGAAFYRLELGDRNMRLNNAFRDFPGAGFVTTGEKVNRSSGDLSAGFRFDAADDVSLGAGYTIQLEDKYIGHQFGLNLVVRF